MRAFRDGEIKILVSTSVIEVGIDVPNASVILIEGAERFGLAQLHQLRGARGAAGNQESHCLLMSETTDPEENARLRTPADGARRLYAGRTRPGTARAGRRDRDAAEWRAGIPVCDGDRSPHHSGGAHRTPRR